METPPNAHQIPKKRSGQAVKISQEMLDFAKANRQNKKKWSEEVIADIKKLRSLEVTNAAILEWLKEKHDLKMARSTLEIKIREIER